MGTRMDLQVLLETLLGSTNVYYQPPEALKLSYPAITYLKNTRYNIIVVDKMPDNPVIDKLLSLPYCSYDRHYNSDKLNHDSLTLYY